MFLDTVRSMYSKLNIGRGSQSSQWTTQRTANVGVTCQCRPVNPKCQFSMQTIDTTALSYDSGHLKKGYTYSIIQF